MEAERIVSELRKVMREYASAVHDTMRALHNRCGCTVGDPCAYCRRRIKAETELLKLIGSAPAAPWLGELTAPLCAADAGKPKM